MQPIPRLLDVVALLSDVPAHGIVQCQVSSVVDLLDGAYEVEFSDCVERLRIKRSSWQTSFQTGA